MPLNFVRLFVNSCLEETKDEILLKYNDSDRFASYDIQERNKLESVCTQYMSEKFIPKDVLQQVVCIIESCLNRINPVFVVHNFINKILDCTDVGKQYLQNLKPEKLHVAGLFVRSLRHTHSYFNPLMSRENFGTLQSIYEKCHTNGKQISEDDMIKIVEIMADYCQQHKNFFLWMQCLKEYDSEQMTAARYSAYQGAP